MSESNQKSELEEKLILSQIRNERTGFRFSLINTIFFVLTVLGSAVGSTWLYYNYNKPQDDRERIKLVLEVMKEKDPFVQKKGIEMVQEVYPTESKRLQEIDRQIINKIKLRGYELSKKQAEDELDKSKSQEERILIQENINEWNNKINSIKSSSEE
jgi:hypothetical protein